MVQQNQFQHKRLQTYLRKRAEHSISFEPSIEQVCRQVAKEGRHTFARSIRARVVSGVPIVRRV